MPRILVIGTGSIGERHLRCLLSTGRCALGICESNEEKRVRAAQQYGIASVHASVEEALAKESWSAAVIATPAPSHVPIALELLGRGLHLLIEKPLSLSMESIDELAALARTNQRVVAVGYMHRAHPAMIALKKAIQEGTLGPLRQLRLDFGQPLAALRPAYREIYFASPQQGGGALLDFMTHAYNLAEYLAGPISRIATDADHQGLEGVAVEDTVHSLARHGKVMSSFSCSLTQPANEFLVTVTGEKAMARADYAQQRWSLLTEPLGPWIHHDASIPDWDFVYRRQDEAFLDAIERKGDVFCGLEEGIQTLRVNLASRESWRTGRWAEPSDQK